MQEADTVTHDPLFAIAARTVLVAGAAALAGCGGRDAVPDVAEQTSRLSSGTDDDRYTALAALQTLGPGGRGAVDALKTLLKATKDDDLAAEIAKTLGTIGPDAAPALPELTALLGRKAMWPRYAAVEAIGRLGPAAAAALPAVLKLTKDPDRDVAAAARESARRLHRTRKAK